MKLYPTRPGAILLDGRGNVAEGDIVRGLADMLRVEIPENDPYVRQVLGYCDFVARFIMGLYKKLKALSGMSEDNLEYTGCFMKIVFHGKEAAPAFAIMRLKRSAYYMRPYYLISTPALGRALFENEYLAEQWAKEMGAVQHYWYSMEKWTVQLADFFFTTPSGNCSIAASSHYGITPNTAPTLIKGKCNDLKMKLS